MNDDLHFWTQPIFGGQSESIPLSLLCLLYTIFEASPPEALFVSRKSGESNHPCLGSDGQNVGFSWTRGNQGYSYSGYPIQTDPRTSVTSIFYHFQTSPFVVFILLSTSRTQVREAWG